MAAAATRSQRAWLISGLLHLRQDHDGQNGCRGGVERPGGRRFLGDRLSVSKLSGPAAWPHQERRRDCTWTEDIQGVRRPEKAKISEDRAIALVRGVIVAAYKRGDVVIVGRGGQAILRDHPGVLHVRVEAPLAHRMEAVMERTDMPPTQVEMAIEDQDRAAQSYVKRFYDIDPTDPIHYHLVVNTGLLDQRARPGDCAGGAAHEAGA